MQSKTHVTDPIEIIPHRWFYIETTDTLRSHDLPSSRTTQAQSAHPLAATFGLSEARETEQEGMGALCRASVIYLSGTFQTAF